MHKRRRAARLCGVVLLFGLAARLGWLCYTRPPRQPAPEQRTLYRGIIYRREVRRQPRPLVIHIVTIDLQAPGLGFLVTPGDAKAKRPLKAQTVRQFLQANRAQLAINGDYFWPWYSYSILNYYPHSGDPVSVRGIAASRGVVYSRGSKRYPHPTLHLSQTNRAQICQPREVPAQPIYNAVSGNFLLLHDGKINVPEQGSEEWTAFQPRNSVGLDKARRHLILLEVDGRQTGYSEGTTLAETAQLLRENGAWEAINLDGGGSETLIIEGPKGPETLNSPIDCNIPGRERAVANHLGVFAQRQ